MTTPFPRGLLLVGLALTLFQSLAAAGPLEEVRSASGLGASLDAERLKRGEVISERGTKGSFLRGIYVESCYFVKAPLAKVGAARVQGGASGDADEKSAPYQLFRAPGSADLARVARLQPDRKADRWMLDRSEATAGNGQAGELHLTPAEIAVFRAKEIRDAGVAWERVLRARAEAVAAGGIAASASYKAGDTTIAAQEELRSLLGMTPGIAARFKAAVDTDPKAPGDRWYYASRSPIQDHSSFSLGTITAAPSAESWQVMNCTYYTSDTYFMSADLYYLWAWEGGTLVWQVDYISAPFQAYRGGLDKLIGGRQLLAASGEGIAAFRRRVEK